MSIAENMKTKLEAEFLPLHLEILDESSKHAGHAGARPGGETHFRLYIVSDAFAGCNRVARQRMIMTCLQAELADRVHALSIKALSPDELD